MSLFDKIKSAVTGYQTVIDNRTKPLGIPFNDIYNVQSESEKLLNKIKGSMSKTGTQGLNQDGGSKDELIYPVDLLSTRSNADHPGLVVVFELNRTVGAGAADKQYRDKVKATTRRDIKSFQGGVINKEAAMYDTAKFSGSARGANSLGNSGTGRYVKTDQRIILPPPDIWVDGNIINWANTNLMAIEGGSNTIEAIASDDMKAAGARAGELAQAAGLNIVGTLTGTDPMAKFNLVTGKTFNPYTEVLFQSVNNRFFPFQYTFTPRSAAEAEEVRQIIHRFRWASLPEMLNEGTTSTFMQAPYVFDIYFVELDNQGRLSRWWPRIGTCALTNISTNRTPQGEFSVINDKGENIPTVITLELQFTELVILTKSALSDLNDSY